MTIRARSRIARSLLMLAGGFALPSLGAAAGYRLLPEGSTLKFIAVQQGAKFESHFDRFTANVDFDPAAPATGRIEATISLGSVDTGSADRDEVLKTDDWFAVARWGEAEYHADRISRDGAGFLADGELSLRGVSRPVALRFSWTPARGEQPARLTGVADLHRLDFGVGQGEWRDTAYVGNDVQVLVDIQLRQVNPLPIQ